MAHTSRAIAGAASVTAGRPVALARTETAGMNRPTHISGTLLTISEERSGRRAVLSVAGEVDINSATELRTTIESAATGAFEIWLDLSALTFMDSSGLHAMSEARLRLTEANIRLTVICPEGPVLRVLALTGFDRIFEVHPSRSAANHATRAERHRAGDTAGR
jgi:anti-sigma B factor antagonist